MPNKIQDIITTFKGKTFSSHEEVVEWLDSSLTSLLDSIKGECNKVSSDGDTEWADGYNTKNQEVINIIKSHR